MDNVELRDVAPPPHKISLGSQIKKHEMDGTHALRGEQQKNAAFWWETPKKGAFARPRRRWEDNNKIGLTVLDCIQWRDGNEPAGSIK